MSLFVSTSPIFHSLSNVTTQPRLLIMKNKDGCSRQQNGDFILPIIGNKVDDRLLFSGILLYNL